MADRVKARADALAKQAPFADQPIMVSGQPVWHQGPGQRMAMTLPPDAAGPINAREVRAQKKRNRGD